jgi:GNAT superfamily N-acetyltransferase
VPVVLRAGRPDDLPAVRAALHEHAATEGGLVPPAHDELAEALFGPAPAAHVVIAETDHEPPRFAGLALWWPTFSSWSLRRGIWLEDLWVHPDFRRAGVGRQLMDHLRARTDGRIEWDVGHGNERAARFYRALGAAPAGGFDRYRWAR